MPNMTRSVANRVADTLANFKSLIGHKHHAMLTASMSEALTGVSSNFHADRFRDRCHGIRTGR